MQQAPLTRSPCCARYGIPRVFLAGRSRWRRQAWLLGGGARRAGIRRILRASIIALRERDGEVAVDTRGSGREIGDALAEVFGLEGKLLIPDALLLLLRPSAQ